MKFIQIKVYFPSVITDKAVGSKTFIFNINWLYEYVHPCLFFRESDFLNFGCNVSAMQREMGS